MKKIFVVFVQESEGKLFAFASTIRCGENLVPYCKRYNAKICHLCESAKEAGEIAYNWNESYKRNGTSLI